MGKADGSSGRHKLARGINSTARGQKLSNPLPVLRRFRRGQSFQRPDGKEFVAAGVATKRRKAEQAANEAKSSGHIFGRNPLDVEIAADGAMGVAQVTQRNGTGAEAQFALQATPGNEADDAAGNVGKPVSPGATA